MKKILLAAFCLASLAAAAAPRAPTDAEMRAKQAIGRALVSPDGQFFVYEWMRPYSWVRDTGSLPKPAAERMQTWLYRVDIDRLPAEYLFFPGPEASYWLGAFSPDGRNLSFYQLDNDNNVLKTGVASFTDAIVPQLTWFDAAPDGSKLDQPPVWLSNDELVYPAKSGLVRAKMPGTGATDSDKPVAAEPCADCAARVAQARDAAKNAKPKAAGKPPADSRLIAQSADGELEVYERNSKSVLGVLFRKGADASETVVFENEKSLAPWSPPKWPDRKEDSGLGDRTKPVAEASPPEKKSTK